MAPSMKLTDPPSSAIAPRRRALLVGINAYAHGDIPRLKGCVNDAELMSRILQDRFAFPPDDLTLLRDAEATRDAVLDALAGLLERTGPDDIAVFFFAGHGSQMTDREGDKPSGLDQTLVPHDSSHQAPHENRDITDDEIHDWLRRMGQKTRHVSLIFDCCHSATLHRDLHTRGAPPDLRPAAALPPSPVSSARGGARTGPSGWLPLSDRYVVIAGCRDDESAHDNPFRAGSRVVWHGELTYHLAEYLLQAGPGATYRDAFEQASAAVTRRRPGQHPQIEGAADRELFGVRDLVPMRFVPVLRRAGEQVVLAGGAVHGLVPGSAWDVHGPGTKDPGGAPLGRLEIVAVEGLRATARIVAEERPGAVAAGGRAVEVHRPPQARRTVAVPPGAGPLRALLDGSPWLHPVEDAEGAWAAVAATTEGLLASGPGGPLMEAVPADDPAALLDRLELLARHDMALELQPPDGPLQGKVELVLLRKGKGGRFERALPDEGGQLVFAEGECIAMRITNRHDAPLYVTLLDFGISRRIAQVYPPPGAKERLPAGASVDIGTRDDDELPLYLPEELPRRTGPSGAPAAESESLRLFACTEEVDLTPLLQDGMRGKMPEFTGAATALGQLLGRALAGAAREVPVARSRGPEAWTAVTCHFLLRP